MSDNGPPGQIQPIEPYDWLSIGLESTPCATCSLRSWCGAQAEPGATGATWGAVQGTHYVCHPAKSTVYAGSGAG